MSLAWWLDHFHNDPVLAEADAREVLPGCNVTARGQVLLYGRPVTGQVFKELVSAVQAIQGARLRAAPRVQLSDLGRSGSFVQRWRND